MNENRPAKKIIKIANNIINIIVIALIIAAVAIGIYALSDTGRVVTQGAPTEYAKYKPKNDTLSFEELTSINPEVIGWINVYGTKIDYPIVQGQDNDKYVTTSATGQYSLLGSIFLDCRNKKDFSDFSSILYGHNMTPRAMFGNIKDFREREYFDSHRYGDLFYEGAHHGLEFFAVFRGDAYSSFLLQTGIETDERKQTYLNDIYDKALFSRDIGVSINDRIVLLYTCSNAVTNGRDLLAARISDNTFENPFGDEDKGNNNFFGIFDGFPFWILPFIILAILIFIRYMLWRREKKKREKNGRR